MELGKMIGKSAERKIDENELMRFEQMNMNSYLDVRGIPINKGAISLNDIVEGY